MGSSRRGSAEINVTPLIAASLAVLVIFLIATPDLVKSEVITSPSPPGCGLDVPPILVVRLHADLSATLVDEGDEIPLDARELSAGLRAHLHETPEVVYIELDESVRWEHVIATVDAIHGLVPSTSVALRMPGQ